MSVGRRAPSWRHRSARSNLPLSPALPGADQRQHLPACAKLLEKLEWLEGALPACPPPPQLLALAALG
ncbi:hCG1818858 [Homo sapiens]|uniref:HCG1818858 n=1 Tax=Homo sapiens TaxID=9606 RepID=Q53SM3_HUMAN